MSAIMSSYNGASLLSLAKSIYYRGRDWLGGGGRGNRGILRVASVVYDDSLFIRIFWVSPLSHKMTFLIRCHDTLTIVFKAIYTYIDAMPRYLL